MTHNIEVPEVPEYGLNIPNEALSPRTVCGGCEGNYSIWPGMDWLYCQKCNRGISRTAARTDQWTIAATPADRTLLNDYETKVVARRNAAELFWNKLNVNLNHSGTLLTLKMGAYMKTVDTEKDHETLRWLAQQDIYENHPYDLFRLEDLPGRLTGFVIYKKEGQHFKYQLLPVIDGARIAFLSSPEDTNQLSGHILVPDFVSAMMMKSRATKLSGKALPIVFSDISARVWEPCTKTAPVLFVNELNANLLKALLKAKASSRLVIRKLATTFTAAAVPQWYDKVHQSSAPWRVVLGEEFRNLGPERTVKFVRGAGLTSDEMKYLLDEMPEDFRIRMEAAESAKDRSYRLSPQITVYDDGTCWKDQRGELILSASFRILSAQRNATTNVVYRCSLTWDDGELLFDSGPALERNAFRILLREALMAGRTLTFNLKFSKRAIEIAAGLRPITRPSASDA